MVMTTSNGAVKHTVEPVPDLDYDQRFHEILNDYRRQTRSLCLKSQHMSEAIYDCFEVMQNVFAPDADEWCPELMGFTSTGNAFVVGYIELMKATALEITKQFMQRSDALVAEFLADEEVSDGAA